MRITPGCDNFPRIAIYISASCVFCSFCSFDSSSAFRANDFLDSICVTWKI